MKKIFVLTGEPSGDKLASKVIYTTGEKIQKVIKTYVRYRIFICWR